MFGAWGSKPSPMPQFKAAGAQVVGMSADDVETLKKLVKQAKQAESDAKTGSVQISKTICFAGPLPGSEAAIKEAMVRFT